MLRRQLLVTALATACALPCFAFTPASGARIGVLSDGRPATQFRTELVDVIATAGFTPDSYSDVDKGNRPFRRLGRKWVATFSHKQLQRVSIQVFVDADGKASIWISESMSEKLSAETRSVVEKILINSRERFGAEKVTKE